MLSPEAQPRGKCRTQAVAAHTCLTSPRHPQIGCIYAKAQRCRATSIGLRARGGRARCPRPYEALCVAGGGGITIRRAKKRTRRKHSDRPITAHQGPAGRSLLRAVGSRGLRPPSSMERARIADDVQDFALVLHKRRSEFLSLNLSGRL